MKLKALAIALFALSSSSAFAAIGPAGCGLGNMVFGAQPGMIQVVAATLNGTGVQTFGITSGTSNCGPDHSMAQVIMFVESNRIALSNEAARGQGETVAALSTLMGCTDSQSLGQTLKSNYGEIFGANGENSIAISRSIKSAVQKSPALARTCQPLG